jgi:hypothetical protein
MLQKILPQKIKIKNGKRKKRKAPENGIVTRILLVTVQMDLISFAKNQAAPSQSQS